MHELPDAPDRAVAHLVALDLMRVVVALPPPGARPLDPLMLRRRLAAHCGVPAHALGEAICCGDCLAAWLLRPDLVREGGIKVTEHLCIGAQVLDVNFGVDGLAWRMIWGCAAARYSRDGAVRDRN